MKDFIEVYENTLTKEVCDKVMTYTDMRLSTMSEDEKRGSIGHEEGDKVDIKLKDSYDLNMELDDNNEISRKIGLNGKIRAEKFFSSIEMAKKYQNLL